MKIKKYRGNKKDKKAKRRGNFFCGDPKHKKKL